jgi:hypothetical protein
MISVGGETHWTFERAAGLAGVAAAILIVVSAALSGAPDEAQATDQRLIDFYADPGNHYRLYAGAIVGLAAMLCLLWFLVGLRDRLERVERSGLPSLVFAAGLVFVVLACLAGAIGTALPAGLVYSQELAVADVDALRVLLILGNHWLSGAAASTAALVVGGASLVALRHRLYSRWLASTGLVIAVLMLPSMVAFAGFTVIGLVIWSFALGIWLARARSAPRS